MTKPELELAMIYRLRVRGPHVRLPFLTDDGALVLMEYRGIVHATPAFERAVAQDTATEWGISTCAWR
jgi:hypothetical protein